MVDRFTNAGFYSAVALAAINRLNLSRLDLSSVDYGLGEKFAIMLFLLFSICFQSKGIYIFMPNIEPVPAATVVLVRESPQQEDLEVLLLLRNSKLAFHGGHWVFPGGRVDKADFQDSADGLEYPRRFTLQLASDDSAASTESCFVADLCMLALVVCRPERHCRPLHFPEKVEHQAETIHLVLPFGRDDH